MNHNGTNYDHQPPIPDTIWTAIMLTDGTQCSVFSSQLRVYWKLAKTESPVEKGRRLHQELVDFSEAHGLEFDGGDIWEND